MTITEFSIRTKAELDGMLISHSEKIPRVQKDLSDLLRFPDARKKKIYEGLVNAGEVEAAPEDGSKLDLKIMEKVDAEFQEQLSHYQRKVGRLTEICTLIEAEKINRGDILH